MGSRAVAVCVAAGLLAGTPASTATASPIAGGAVCTMAYDVYLTRGRSAPWPHDERADPERVAAYWERWGNVDAMSHPVWYKFLFFGENDPCAANPYRWLKEAMKWGDIIIPLPRRWYWATHPHTGAREWVLQDRWRYVVFAAGMPASIVERLIRGELDYLDDAQIEKLITIFRRRYPSLLVPEPRNS